MNRKGNASGIISICMIFLFFKYIAQLYPSLLSNHLIERFGLTGVEMGILASSYYYSYSFMQFGAGIILDRFDIRIPSFLAVFSIAVSIYGFAHTDAFYMMCLYRALMGIGCSFATVLYMKCAATWTSQRVFEIISPFLSTATMLGAAVGAAPIAILFNHYGWREGLILVSFFGMILSVIVLLFVHSGAHHNSERTPTFVDLKKVVFSSDNIWLLVYSGLTFSPIVILGGLWGVPFLELKFNISSSGAATLISLMFLGHALGSPIWGAMASTKNDKKFFMLLANVLAFISLSMLIAVPMTYGIAEALFFMFGFSVSCFMLSFNICRQVNPVAVMGFAVALINSGEGLVSCVLEPGIGYILDVLKSENSQHFELQNYQYALSILPMCFIVSSWVVMKLPFSEEEGDTGMLEAEFSV